MQVDETEASGHTRTRSIGESVTKNYFSFIYNTEQGFAGVEDVTIVNDTIQIKAKDNRTDINLKLTPGLIHELSK